MDAKLSSWEELDKSLLADDVRGGFAAPSGRGWHLMSPRTPQHLQRRQSLAENASNQKLAILNPVRENVLTLTGSFGTLEIF